MRTLISAISLAVLALPLAAQTTDSPLVAAAKANLARIAAIKTTPVVITNDNLIRIGGHLGTTDNDTSVAALAAGAPKQNPNARAEAETTARREAQAAKLKLLKDDPAAFYKQYGEDRPPTYQPASTVQMGQGTTQTPVARATGAQLQSATTTQLHSATTKQPQATATTVNPTQH